MGLFSGNKEERPRFVEIYCAAAGNNAVLVDTLTGVNYFFHRSKLDSASGMVVLVDADGKPIVTPPEELEKILNPQ